MMYLINYTRYYYKESLDRWLLVSPWIVHGICYCILIDYGMPISVSPVGPLFESDMNSVKKK